MPTTKYRSTLYFWGNTVTHTSSEYRNIAFGLSLKPTTAHVWNNTITFGPQATSHTWLEYAGVLSLHASNVITGTVALSGRDNSNPAMISIVQRAEAAPAGFVAP
jgi:hypothetical protein